MGILKKSYLFISALLLITLGSISHADFLPMLDGVEISATGALGTENTNYYGFNGDLEFGNLENDQGITGDFHLNYTNNIEPENPSVSATPYKSVTYWVGGFSLAPWTKGTLGLDYDSNNDPYETLYTTGIKVSLGQNPLTLSYRNAETQLVSPTGVYVLPADQGKVRFNGAFMYQESLDLAGQFHPTKASSLYADVSASWYTPSAADFTNLLSQQALSSLSNLQNALQNFEQWSVDFSWRQKWTKRFETKISQLYSVLIVATSPYTVTTVTAGYHWNSSYYTGLSYEYSYTPVGDNSFAVLELRWNWDRDN